MAEFLEKYWYFIVAGVIFLAVVIYWIIEIAKSKKQKNAIYAQNIEQQTEETFVEEKSEPVKEEKVEEVKVLKEKEVKKTKAEPKKEVKPAKQETKPVVNKAEEKKEVIQTENEEKPSYNVIYDPDKYDWVVRRDGSEKATKRCRTKQEALEVIENLAKNNELHVTVNKKDGEVQKVTKSKKA